MSSHADLPLSAKRGNVNANSFCNPNLQRPEISLPFKKIPATENSERSKFSCRLKKSTRGFFCLPQVNAQRTAPTPRTTRRRRTAHSTATPRRRSPLGTIWPRASLPGYSVTGDREPPAGESCAHHKSTRMRGPRRERATFPDFGTTPRAALRH
jgi:hypothetical protein